MDDSQLERLISQCRSNDNDVKTDAVTKMQAEFEAGVEIADPDALVSVLKACLRTPNQHLTTATLGALPPLLPLLITRSAIGLGASTSSSPAASTSSLSASVIDVHTLRQVVHAFLPSGGVFDRLGDNRERARDKARETIVLLGGYAFRSSSIGSSMRAGGAKGPETPLMGFEKFLKELGLSSKVWRVREQAILTLVQIRRVHHLFPIRPYLPALVEALEDSDSTVRECAKQSVVELFTGPGVTDGARADLKKEMTKKNVRKNIVETVLARVLAGASVTTPLSMSEAGSENGDSTGGYVPPSVALKTKRPGIASGGGGMSRTASQVHVKEPSRPASRAAVVSPTPMEGVSTPGNSDVKSVYITSSRDLENEFASMLKHFDGKETEHNWAAREQAIMRVRGMLKGEVHERYPETFLQGLIQGFISASIKTLISLRTTVSSTTCSLYTELIIALGPALDPVCETLYTNLLRMASLTKKIVAQQSQTTVALLMNNTSAQPRLVLPLLWNGLQDKAIQTRLYIIGHVKTYLETHGTRARHAIEANGGVDTLDKCIRKGLADPNPGVRETARQAFWLFEGIWRDRGRIMLESLDGVSKKQLEKACPDPETLTSLAPVLATPQTKKSSVAAAIAASRAKAKAIASAPPSLRHQATSAARTTSPPSKRPLSPSLSTSNSTGPERASSPISRVASSSSPPRSRVLSTGGFSRSVSSGFVPNREPVRQAPPPSPPSPTPGQTYRRRVSSPLGASTNGGSVLRRAVQTALPASPPSSALNLASRMQPQHGVRDSINIAGFHRGNEDSLLLASNIPIPEDSDSDMDIDNSVNLISFSSPYEVYPPTAMTPQARSAASFSPRSSSSRPPLSNALSTGTSSPSAGVPQPIVEDALRATAEQAESAAERLLELVDPEEEGLQSLTIPPSLLLGTGMRVTPKLISRTASGSSGASKNTIVPPLPKTPVNKSAAIMRKAALFQDSPAYSNKTSTSLLDIINRRDGDNVWWNKRMSLSNERSTIEVAEPSDRKDELNAHIAALEQGTADVRVLKELALFCRESHVNESNSPISPDFSGPLSPSPLFGNSQSLSSSSSDLWNQDKAFERLFSALMQYLEPARDTSELEYGLIVLWELLDHQAPLLEGREADIFAALLRVRYNAYATVMQATTTFRDALTSRIEPVYGLTTMHASIRAFRVLPLPALIDVEIRNGSYAFGLIALGKFILRLPAEVLEDELPRLKATLTSALTDTSSESSLNVREAAAASITAAQLVLRDEAHLFVLLDGLPEDKKNLLTYLFDKHGCRDTAGDIGQTGVEKLEREMRRLDGRTSTPLRPSTGSPFV